MREVTFEQGSLEWKLYRMEHANASEAGAVMDCCPAWMQINTPYKLWQYKQGDLEFDDSGYAGKLVAHGQEMEGVALSWLCLDSGYELKPAVFESDYGGVSFSASLDAFGKASLSVSVKAEIKCPATGLESSTWKDAKMGVIPDHYYWQIVHQEMVCPTDVTYFLVYVDPDHVIKLDMDEAYPAWMDDIERLRKAWLDFYSKPPEPDWEERSEQEWIIAEQNFVAAKEREAAVKEELAAAKEALISMATTSKARGESVEVSKRLRSGTIQYSKIPNLAEIDLNAFRSKSKSFWDVRLRRK